MTAPVAHGLGMAVPFGGIFARPEAGSPAARARIKAGDVVTAINGVPLASSQDFADRIVAMAPRTTISLATRRNGQPMRHTVTLASGKCPGAQPRK